MPQQRPSSSYPSPSRTDLASSIRRVYGFLPERNRGDSRSVSEILALGISTDTLSAKAGLPPGTVWSILSALHKRHAAEQYHDEHAMRYVWFREEPLKEEDIPMLLDSIVVDDAIAPPSVEEGGPLSSAVQQLGPSQQADLRLRHDWTAYARKFVDGGYSLTKHGDMTRFFRAVDFPHILGLKTARFKEEVAKLTTTAAVTAAATTMDAPAREMEEGAGKPMLRRRRPSLSGADSAGLVYALKSLSSERKLLEKGFLEEKKVLVLTKKGKRLLRELS